LFDFYQTIDSLIGAGEAGVPAVAVIDEEDAVCDQAGDCFCRAGFVVHSAMTADAGVARLKRGRFDLVLVDVFLRDASGTLVAQIAANMNTPVLLTTGRADAASRLRQFDFPHLLKPFDFAQLSKESVRVMLENRQTILQLILNLERLRRSLADLEAATADARRLIAVSQAILARPAHSPLVTGAPAPAAEGFNPFGLIRLADRKIAGGRIEQAEKLIDAAYDAYDQCSFWFRPGS
jgi:CheY-like chemotaxis protein